MPTITIKKRDTTTAVAEMPNGTLCIVQGDGFLLSSEGQLVFWQASRDVLDSSHFYQRNLSAILGAEDTEEFSFSAESNQDDGYYVSRIQGVTPYTVEVSAGWASDFAITGGPTCRIGADYENSTILLSDIARPDVDCDDYVRLTTYINRIRAVMDGIKDQIVGTPSLRGAGVTFEEPFVYGVHKQYQAMQHMWNFLVRNLSLVVNVSFQATGDGGASVFMQIKVHNNTGTEAKLNPLSITMHAEGSSYANLRIQQSGLLKVVRSTNDARIAFDLNLTTLPVDTGGEWIMTPRTDTDPPVDVFMAPDEAISISIELGLYSISGARALPNQLRFSVSTQVPDLTSGGASTCVVSRDRGVYVPTTSITKVVEP